MISSENSARQKKVLKLCYYSSDPPLVKNAYANHGVARNFIDILREFDPVVLTSKSRRYVNMQEVRNICGDLPLWIHPSLSGYGFRKIFPTLTGIIDAIIFAFWMPILAWRLSKAKVDRIFIHCNADAWFLFHIWLIQKLGIPVDIYFTDDIEDSATRGLYRKFRFIIHPLLKNVLGRSRKNFGISQGFVESLIDRYGVAAEWLPLPMAHFPLRSEKSKPSPTGERFVVFVGAINRLYESSLRELYDEICRYNSENVDQKLKLKLISYGGAFQFRDSLPNQDSVVAYEKLPKSDLDSHLSTAYACFLPYSFLPSEKLMVSTSFSCKILEYFQCQRPIIVYGPSYASTPRYFKELGLPLCATSLQELRVALLDVERYDDDQLMIRYYKAWRRFHSPEAIQSVLLPNS